MKKNHIKIFKSKLDGSEHKLIAENKYAPTENDIIGHVLTEIIPGTSYDSETESIIIPKEIIDSLIEPDNI